MIEIILKQTTDLEAQGVKQIFKNHIYIGRNVGDVIIEDANVINNHLFIEILPDENILYCHPNPKIGHYLVNSKRCESARKLQIGDTFAIEKNIFEVVSFELEKHHSYNDELKKNFDQLINENSELLEVIKVIKTKIGTLNGK